LPHSTRTASDLEIGNLIYLVASREDAARFFGTWRSASDYYGELLIGRVVRQPLGKVAMVRVYQDGQYQLEFSAGGVSSTKWVSSLKDWDLLDEGNASFRSNDAGLAYEELVPELVGDGNDREGTCVDNAAWLRRRRAWYAGRRFDGTMNEEILEAKLQQPLGLPPIGQVLTIASEGQTRVVRCALCYYPEDTARGRASTHGPVDLFLSLEPTRPEEPWQPVDSDLRLNANACIFLVPKNTPEGYCWPRELKSTYSLSRDVYLNLGDKGPFTNRDELANSFLYTSMTTSGSEACNEGFQTLTQGMALAEAVLHSDTPQGCGAIGRQVCVHRTSATHEGDDDDDDEEEVSSSGIVIAFNTSTEEHCVHFYGSASSEEWLDLSTTKVTWAKVSDLLGGQRPQLTWVPSGGTWAALLQGDCSRDLYERLCCPKIPTPAFPLNDLLQPLVVDVKNPPQPFQLPECVLEILDETCPQVMDEPAESSFQDDAETSSSPHVSDDHLLKGTCARSRPWCKEAHRKAKESAHASRRGTAPTQEGSNLDDQHTETSRQREGRREARVVRGSGLGSSSALWEDGRLEQGGFGTGNKRLRFGRSGIEGWGVYTDACLEKGEGVLEYRGVMIGNAVADRREHMYRAQGRDDYQFRIDDCTVVDATRKGSLARYVNHSCDPNCFTQIVEYGPKKKIVIYARRRIEAGEELTYDYKFAIEEGADKLLCACGAVRCRGWMN